MDVLVVGGGPAGAALLDALLVLGVDAYLIATEPEAPWRNNYGLWLQELPQPLHRFAEQIWPGVEVTAQSTHLLQRPYARLDNHALQGHFFIRSAGRRLCGQVADADYGNRTKVRLADGRVLEAGLVVDASGHQPVLLKREDQRAPGFQVAYGVLAELRQPWVGAPRLMDFSDRHLEPNVGPPSFCYALPLGDRLFVEETVLVGRPPASLDLLKTRLEARIAHQGWQLGDILEVERCVIPMGHALPVRGQRVVGFGAAASLVHPATGYSVGMSLGLAPLVAQAIAEKRSAPEIEAVIWPSTRRKAWRLYQFGMEILIRLEPQQMRSFFEAFFALPEDDWSPYLSGRLDAAGVARVMRRVFGLLPGPLRRHLVARTFSADGRRLWEALWD